MEINNVLIKSFEKWMHTLGYAKSTVYNTVFYTNDFAEWLKARQITRLEQINKQVINDYYNNLHIRKNKRQTGSLTQNYIGTHLNALKNFSKYLEKTGKAFLEIDIRCERTSAMPKTILDTMEIKALYRACGNDFLGIRDKALLHIYYGCGLRRSEGVALELQDVLLKEKVIHVKKGKGNKERYVPMTESMKTDLENYIYVAREKLLRFSNIPTDVFFINTRSQPMSGGGIYKRIKRLAEKARIQKETGLHILRHSIATHLLQSGMSLEEVSHFLGHSSLGSTQIYTHVAADQE